MTAGGQAQLLMHWFLNIFAHNQPQTFSTLHPFKLQVFKIGRLTREQIYQ